MKNYSKFKLLLAVLLVSLLAACASNEEKQEEYSGFLAADQYGKVVKIELEDGDIVYRWISPNFNRDSYHSIIVDQVGYYPAPQTSEQASQATLDEIANYMTLTLKGHLGEVTKITDQAGPGVARLTSAITGVQIETEDMKAYEVVPVAAIFAAASAAAGKRDMVTEVYLESKLQNTETGEYLGFSLRKISGNNLDDIKDHLVLEDIRGSLDEVARDAVEVLTAK